MFSALLFVFVFILPPALPSGSGRRPIAEVFYALLLLSGVHALGQRPLARMLLMPVAVLTIALQAASWVWPLGQAWGLGTGLLSLLLLLAVVLVQTLRSGPVTAHRIQGAVGAYVLLGLIWAHAYALATVLLPGAFAGAAISVADGPRGWLYFSFVTLTTVGYGDVVPVHPAARSLAMLEAVAGPLYLAILIARLVSLSVTPSTVEGSS